MARPGRKSHVLTEDQRRLSGESKKTPRKRQKDLNKVAPQPILPFPPDFLDERGKFIFNSIAAHVSKSTSIYDVDSYLVGQAALWQRLSEKNAEQLIKEGFLASVDGVNPLLIAQQKISKEVAGYYKELGIGVKARQAITAFINDADLAEGKTDGAIDPALI